MQRLSVEVKLPYLSKEHSCKEQLKIFTKKRIKKMQTDMEKISIKCQNDLYEFADQISTLEACPAYKCEWTEEDTKTEYAAYFLYRFQAEDCKLSRRPNGKIEYVTVFQDKHNKKYYILDEKDCMKKIQIYIPLTLEEKENDLRKAEIARLEKKLHYLQKGCF